MDVRHPEDEDGKAAGRDRAGVDVARRRFTRAGLSGSVVLGSLASKPVLGAVPYHCTVSGQVSGNLSRAAVAGECVLGQSTRYWLDNAWPAGLIKGALPSDQCVFTNSSGGRPRGTNFNGYTPGVGVPALIDAFFNLETGSGSTQACSVVVAPTTSTDPSTMLQVLSTTNGGDQFLLGRVVVTSLLNAASVGNAYPVTTHTIIAMFNATFGGGVYQVVVGSINVPWSRTRVIQYLQSLYPPSV